MKVWEKSLLTMSAQTQGKGRDVQNPALWASGVRNLEILNHVPADTHKLKIGRIVH